MNSVPQGSASCSLTKDGCPISRFVFCQMWDSNTLSLRLSVHPMHLAVNIGGIPHLAKNERDMGHPSFVREQEICVLLLFGSATARLCRGSFSTGSHPDTLAPQPVKALPHPTQARPENSRFSVDTFTFSPSLMKSGTRISRPVSSLASLVTLPLEESPFTAGSV